MEPLCCVHLNIFCIFYGLRNIPPHRCALKEMTEAGETSRKHVPLTIIVLFEFLFEILLEFLIEFLPRNFRAISTARLSASPHLHLRPIDVVVCDGPWRDLILEPASCLDAFSTYPAQTRLPGCAPRRDNRCTGGLSNTVLSY